MLDNRIVSAYIECALWSSYDGEDEDLLNYDLSSDTNAFLVSLVESFFSNHADLIEQFMTDEGVDQEQVAHIFWLSCNGHGSGFFDYNSDVAKELDSLCGWQGKYKETFLYLGDDGLVYHD